MCTRKWYADIVYSRHSRIPKQIETVLSEKNFP